MGKKDDDAPNSRGIIWKKVASTKTNIVDGEVIETDKDDKPLKKVCIVGFAESYKQAPFDDPSYTIWGMNQLYRWIPRADRWFEMHKDYLSDQVEDSDYLGWLKECQIPIYMLQRDPAIPNSIAYPIDSVVASVVKQYYFTSTVAYMLALAILEGFEQISIYGVDLAADSEYSYQKPNAEYLIGIATDRGIKVNVPVTSALMKQRYLYGYQDKPNDVLPLEDLDKRERVLKDALEKLRLQCIALEGAIDECRNMRKIVAHRERGGTYVFSDVET